MKKIKTPTISDYVEKVAMIWLAISLMAVGFAFALLPFLPGWIFFMPGLSILAKYSSTVADLKIVNQSLNYYEKYIKTYKNFFLRWRRKNGKTKKKK